MEFYSNELYDFFFLDFQNDFTILVNNNIFQHEFDLVLKGFISD
jgi:hypothetical protein